MARVSTMDGGYGAGGPVIHHEFSDHSVLVPDTELLFTAQFHRAGPDLVLTGRDGQHHLIPDYFSSEHHPALVAPNGAHLSPGTVDLLAGSPTPGHYAQAQPTAPPDSIGKIEKVVGDVTVVRNGVSRRAPCRRRRVQERRGADRRQRVVRHLVSRRHRA